MGTNEVNVKSDAKGIVPHHHSSRTDCAPELAVGCCPEKTVRTRFDSAQSTIPPPPVSGAGHKLV